MKAKIRLSARRILTISEELISDKVDAILELVKNMYDELKKK